MNRSVHIVLALSISTPALAVEVPSADLQIAASIQAAPEERRDGAAVLGWTPDGEVITLREGSNDLICLYDNPADDAFSVACYHRDLEPFMARGRELAAEGVEMMDRGRIRFEEIEAGTLAMSREPRTLYVLHGSGVDETTHAVKDPYLRWVIYVPFATPESTGLSTSRLPGAPWLMGSGTAGAHIMITPPRD
jgi:hypothetical protein